MKLLPHFVCLLALTAITRADFTGPYQLQNFTKSTFQNDFATGSTTLTPPGGASPSAVFGYSIFDSSGVEETLGTLSATAAAAGTISFNYHYTGFHAYFQAQAQFQVLVNDVVVLNLVDNQPASAGFTYSGNASFAVQQGDTFAFRVGGSHFDSNGNLYGTLTLTNFFQNARTVTSKADVGPGSLRQVIADAPTLAAILFDPAVFTGGAGNAINLGSQLSIPNKILEINARSVGGVTLNANGTGRCIGNVAGGTLSLGSLGITGGNAGDGGGIYNNATLQMANCAIFGNSAGNAGGGIANVSLGSLAMTNCTVFDNAAGNFSGGVENNGSGANATLTHCTIFNNRATNVVGGVGTGNLTFSHTVVAGNTSPSSPDIFPTPVTFTGPSFIGNNTGTGIAAGFPNGAGNYVGTAAAPLDPALLSFGNYGGPTPSLLPRFDSPLIDRGVASAGTPATDQRGFARNAGAAPDLGAIETNNALAATPAVAFIDNLNTAADSLTVGQPGAVNLFAMKDADIVSQGAHGDGRNTDFDFTTGKITGLPGIPSGSLLFPRSRVSGLRVTIGAIILSEAPTSFLLYGLRSDGSAEFIASGALPAFTANYTSHTVFLPNESPSYPAFRLRFPTNGGNPIVTLADVQLLGRPDLLVPANFSTAWFTVTPPGKQVALAWPAQPFADTLVQANSILSFPVANLRLQNNDGDQVASLFADFTLAGDRQFFRAINQSPIMLLDVDGSDAPAGETENGFTRLSHPSLTGDGVNVPVTLTASSGGVTVTVTNGNQFRDRAYTSSNTDTNSLRSQAYPHLLRDFIALDLADGSLDVTLSGLPAGLYFLTTFHFDRGVLGADNAFRLELTDDNGSTIGPDLAMPLPASAIKGVETLVKSNGTSNVILRVRERSTTNRCRLNGLAITRLAGQ